MAVIGDLFKVGHMKLLFLNLFISFRQTINPQVFEIGPVFRAENRLLLKILFLYV